MSARRIDTVLDAAYACFTRHGVRRTTMEDIAAAAGMSRPALYQHVDNKEDAFRRLVDRMLGATLDGARAAAAAAGPAPDRLLGILQTKLDLVRGVWRDGPAHAAELLSVDARLTADLLAGYDAEMTGLLATVIAGAWPRADATETAELLLALTRGLEADLDTSTRRLRSAVGLLASGLDATHPAPPEEPA